MFFFFSSRRRHTRCSRDWSSDVCSSDLKSRLLPLNDDIAEEMDRYLRARAQRKLPISPETALISNANKGGRAYSGRYLQLCLRSLLQQCSIFTPQGKLPRIHDARHSFAVNALLRWYREGDRKSTRLNSSHGYLSHAGLCL